MKFYLQDSIIESKEKLDEKEFINLLEKLKDSFIKLNTFFNHLKVQYWGNFNKKIFWESEEVKKEIEDLKNFFAGYIKYFSKTSYFKYAKDNKFEISIWKFHEDYNRIVSFYVIWKEFSFFFFELWIHKNEPYFYFKQIVEIIFELFWIKFEMGKTLEKAYNLNDLIKLIDNVSNNLNLAKYNQYNFKYNKWNKKYYKFIGFASEDNFIKLFSYLKEKRIISDFEIFQTAESPYYLKSWYPIWLYNFAQLKLKTWKEIDITWFFLPDRKDGQKQFFTIETSEIDDEIIDFIDQTYFVIKDLIIKNTEKQLIEIFWRKENLLEELKFNFDTWDFSNSVSYVNRMLRLYLKEKWNLTEKIKLTFSTKKKEEILNYIECLKNKYKNKRLKTEIDYFLTGDFDVLKKIDWKCEKEANFLKKYIIEYDARIVRTTKNIDFNKYFWEDFFIDLTQDYKTFENNRLKILKAYVDKITENYEKIDLEIFFGGIIPKFHKRYLYEPSFIEQILQILKEHYQFQLNYNLDELKYLIKFAATAKYEFFSVAKSFIKEYYKKDIFNELYNEFKTKIENWTITREDIFFFDTTLSWVMAGIGEEYQDEIRNFNYYLESKNLILSEIWKIIKNYILACFYWDKSKFDLVKKLSYYLIWKETEYYKLIKLLANIDKNKFSLEEIVNSLAFSSFSSDSEIVEKFVEKNYGFVREIFIKNLSLVVFDYYMDPEKIVDFYKWFFWITKEDIKQLKSISDSNKKLASCIIADDYGNFLKELEEKKKLFSSWQLYPNKVKAEKYLILKDSLVVFKLLERLDIDYQSYLWDISNVIASWNFANISWLEKFLENYFPLDVEFDWEYINVLNFSTSDFRQKLEKYKYDLICLDISKVEVSNHDGFYNSFITLSSCGDLWIIETWRQNYEKVIKKLNKIDQTIKIDLDIYYSKCIQKNTDNVLKILDWVSKQYDLIVSENIKEIYITNHWGIRNYDNWKIYIAIDASLSEVKVEKYDRNLNSCRDWEKTRELKDLLDKLRFFKN